MIHPGLIFRILVVTTIIVLPRGAAAQDGKAAVLKAIDADRERAAKVALEIWDLAEVGYQETRSSALLQQQLRDAGFSVEANGTVLDARFDDFLSGNADLSGNTPPNVRSRFSRVKMSCVSP